jgi:redox-sensitive bicupin YhaK (pirin superfamily)
MVAVTLGRLESLLKERSDMSTFEANPPACVPRSSSAVAMTIDGRPRDLGDFTVRRVLPSPLLRRIGPFTFFDHMGPATLPKGHGMDVRPHPHIGLATVTYLFEGEIVHRDSLGSLQLIRPGDVNWMVAGRGIVHSERSSAEGRADEQHLHGIQSWIALPREHEETHPSFMHHPRAAVPRATREGVTLDVIAGTAYGLRSPVEVLSPTLYVHARLDQGAKLPVDAAHEERGVYVVEGGIRCDGERYEAGTMVVLRPGGEPVLEAEEDSRVMLVGGAKLEGERFLYWNFVSSSQERIAQAKADWKAQRFAKVPGDEIDFIPLPEG